MKKIAPKILNILKCLVNLIVIGLLYITLGLFLNFTRLDTIFAILGILYILFVVIKEAVHYKNNLQEAHTEKSKIYRRITHLFKSKKDKDNYKFISPKQAEIEKTKKTSK